LRKLQLTEKFINGKIEFMLTKKDVIDVKDVIVSSLSEFFVTILAPYLDREHKENKEDHEKLRVELGDKIDLINEHIRDHKKRISKLEDVVNII